MQNDFEAATSAFLIEADPPYKWSQRPGTTPQTDNVSVIGFNACRRNSGVDLQWHPKSKFMKLLLPSDQKDELSSWQKTG